MAPSGSRGPNYDLGKVEGEEVVFQPFAVSSHLLSIEWVSFGCGNFENFLNIHIFIIIALFRGTGGFCGRGACSCSCSGVFHND